MSLKALAAFIILIVVVLVVTTSIVSYNPPVVNSNSDYSKNSTIASQLTNQQDEEQGYIADISFQGTNQILVTVQNTGTSTINFTKAFINGVEATAISPMFENAGVEKGQSVTYSLTSTWTHDQDCAVRIITTRGNNLVFTKTLP